MFKWWREKSIYSAYNCLCRYLYSSKWLPQLDGHFEFCGRQHRPRRQEYIVLYFRHWNMMYTVTYSSKEHNVWPGSNLIFYAWIHQLMQSLLLYSSLTDTSWGKLKKYRYCTYWWTNPIIWLTRIASERKWDMLACFRRSYHPHVRPYNVPKIWPNFV